MLSLLSQTKFKSAIISIHMLACYIVNKRLSAHAWFWLVLLGEQKRNILSWPVASAQCLAAAFCRAHLTDSTRSAGHCSVPYTEWALCGCRTARETDATALVDWSQLPIGGPALGRVHEIQPYGVLYDLDAHADLVGLITSAQVTISQDQAALCNSSTCQAFQNMHLCTLIRPSMLYKQLTKLSHRCLVQRISADHEAAPIHQAYP